MNMVNRWYNYRTKEYDYRGTVPFYLEDYIPQDVSSQALYIGYIKTGSSPVEAAIKVLKLHSPEEKETKK